MSEHRDLYEQKRQALADARAIVERAHEERRVDLTGEEEAAYQRATAEIRRVDDLINAERSRREAEAAREIIESISGPDSSYRGAGLRDDHVQRFFNTPGNGVLEFDFSPCRVTTRGGITGVETRDIGAYVGSGTLGTLAPTYSANELYAKMLDTGQFWRLNPYIVNTPDGNPRTFPILSVYGTATKTAENATLTESDPTLSGVRTAPYKYAHITYTSNELMTDAAIDVQGLVYDHAAGALNKTLGTALATGSGSGEPQGYTAGSVTYTYAGTITPTGMIAMQHTVGQQYRRNASWATNDGNASYLRQYRDGNGGTLGAWLIQPPSAPGAPETVFGAPFIIDNNIPAHGSAVKSVVYGDLYSGMLTHTSGLRFEKSVDYRFNQDQTAWRIVWRVDSKVRDTSAFGVGQATAN